MVATEVVISSLAEAKLADQYGAKRVELCAALEIGGITPSTGLIKACVDNCRLEVHVMIRPRGGGFVYTTEEIDIMLSDIEQVGSLGASGVVFGILDKDGNIDTNNVERLVKKAKSHQLEVTFHRAFDYCKKPVKSMYKLAELGVDRILTSGQQPTAIEGAELITKLASKNQGKLQLMAGSGVAPDNVMQLIDCGVDAVHFSAYKKIKGTDNAQMGAEYKLDEEKINSLMRKVNG